jgi:hypothetical protein
VILRNAARGQALIETIVAVLLLVPLLIATIDLWRRQAAIQSVQSSARAGVLAFHHGVDVEAYAARPDGRVSGSEVTVIATPQPSAAQTAEEWAFGLLVPAQVIGVGQFDLARDQARNARSTARLSEGPALQWLRAGSSPTFQAELSILVDDWQADNAETVRRRTAALSSAGRIAEWRTPLELMAAPMRLFEPAVARLCLGRIEPDIVPTDRLTGSSRGMSDLRTQPC